MAEAYCACTVANLEGLKGIELPTGDGLRPTLEALDKRTRKLENTEHITPPPPMLDPTWDSLTWRICRLARRPSLRSIPRFTPPNIQASLSLLKCAIASIAAPVPFVFPEKEELEETEVLALAAQWLCHVTGHRGIRIHNMVLEIEPIYSLAVDLSLEGETRIPGLGLNPALGMGRRPAANVPPAVFPPPPPRVACCGCCACSCHSKKPSKTCASSINSDSSWRDRRERAARCSVVGWFKKLAFWRRKRIIDDSSSTSDTIFSR
ncbi:hypothetical protein F5B20DRAFT_13570 [Whalleya microplaca]|nr:hypothetical protein F5B20DRAFT_13570 [Whalleya microplaca]